MTKSPIWGAGLACVLGGAVAGNALGSTQPLDRSTIQTFYQSHEMAEGRAEEAVRPPDHYPLVTRNGTVPVGELATRGLYSQARYRAYLYPAEYAPAEVGYEEYRPGEEWRDAPTREALALGDPHVQTEDAMTESDGAEPLQLAAGPANVESVGQAKMVDVNAALAMR